MKTIKITGYRLEVSTIDGRGAGNVYGYTEDRNVAEQWKKKSAWHTYYTIDQTYHFVDSLAELDAVDREKKNRQPWKNSQ